MIPVMDRRRDVLASLSLILAAAGLGCTQPNSVKEQLYRMFVIGLKCFIINSIQLMECFRLFLLIVRYGRRTILDNPDETCGQDLLSLRPPPRHHALATVR
jgi:hypothetical protein